MTSQEQCNRRYRLSSEVDDALPGTALGSRVPMLHARIGRGVRPQDLGIGKLFERIRDAGVVADAKTQRIVLWNPAAEKMFGYSPSEALEMRVEALVPGSLKARHRAGIASYAETGHGPLIGSDTPLDLPAVRKDGQEMRVELSLSPIGTVDETDDPVGGERFVLAIIRDATERKRAEEEIQHLNETLEARVAERTAQLAEREHQLRDLVGKLMVAQEEERRRVAYEVHDGLTQVAIAAHLYLQAFAEDHPPDSATGREELDRALGLVQQTVMEARHVIEGLRPAALDDFGLSTAIRLEVEELRSKGWDVGYEDALGDARLPAEVETALYRVAQKALTNARKHAGTTRAQVKLTRLPGKIHLEVRDFGRGFDPSAPTTNGPGERVGLIGMRERVALLGGELEIRSAPGAGTSAIAEVPLPETTGTDYAR